MRAAILGAGSAGLLHGLSLKAHGVTIDAVYDPDQHKARALAELLHASIAPRSDDTGDAEVIAICSPPSFHAEQAAMFAREGRVVLLEKPIALDEHELDRISGLSHCYSALQWRFGRGLRAIRAAIAAGELGEAPSVNVDLTWQRDDAYFQSRPNWGCGMLLSVGIHAVDAALYALGDEVASASGTRAPTERETSACAWFVTSRGSRISLRLTSSAPRDRTRLSFCGNGVCAEIEGSEADPTAGYVQWDCATNDQARRLRLLECETTGLLVGPLLVPFVGAALRGSPDAPTIADAAPAHRAIYRVYEASTQNA
ncbi:putative secreted oxidoreductase [Labilithrix luteola]|uniref:Putative secreted oxidoreductase n=1 Tax=Labilithrix luteola TaxID=1391654 RepID=A0A0K1PNW2_9BACT|nr:Gfo/Idh/MocA family oxidoreductase [Labilithrix luteola]AKU94804.1 putative secreted oxidoreductase [Labilithrix luteola]